MNTVSIIGRLAADPDLRHTTTGTPVASFRLAVRNPRDAEHPNWIPVTAYGRSAEAVVAHLVKGDQAAVTGSLSSHEWTDTAGSLSSHEWTDTAGARHYRIDVTARTVDFLARKNSGGTTADEQDA